MNKKPLIAAAMALVATVPATCSRFAQYIITYSGDL